MAPVPMASAAPKSGGTLSVDVFGTTWPSLLPWETTQQLSGQPLFDLYASSLLNDGPNRSIQPGLAKSYTFGDGDRTLTIHLRPGLKFQDGTPLNAAAVVFNWQQDEIWEKQTQGVTSGLPAVATNFKALNATTAQIQMSRPFPPAAGALAQGTYGWMVSPTAYKKQGTAKAGLMPVGAGPYKITKDVQNSSITYQKWPGYYNAKNEGFASTITITSVGDESSGLLALQSGQAQALIANGGLQPNTVQQAQQQNIKLVNPAPTWTDFIAFGMKPKSPLANIKARKAIQYATDRQKLNTALFGGRFTVVDQMIASGMIGYSQKVPGMPSYNLAKAKQLVQSIPGGLSVTIQPIVNEPAWVNLAEALQAQWQKAGIKVKINAVAETQALSLLKSGDLQVFLSQVGGTADPALGSLQTFYHNVRLGNDDPKALSLLAKSAEAPTVDGRTKAYETLSQYVVVKQAYVFPLFGKPSTYAIASNVKGLSGNVPVIYLARASVG